jgi:hypothetical protein
MLCKGLWRIGALQPHTPRLLLFAVAQIDETEVQESNSSLHQTASPVASEAVQPQQQQSGNGSSSFSGSSDSSSRPQQRQRTAGGAALREPRPFIPQIDVFKFVGDLLGDPQETLKDTLLGSALATDGEQLQSLMSLSSCRPLAKTAAAYFCVCWQMCMPAPSQNRSQTGSFVPSP